jgi:uncharacterized heparinase superfamily protein
LAADWTPHIFRESARTGHRRFRFLNEEREVVSWNDAGASKLWLYNLHYFESPEEELIEAWIEGNSTGEGNGWEPYPLSLRIVNWIKYALAGGRLSPAAQNSLVAQAEALSSRIEFHLLANHVFVNGKALLFAGAFFGGADADRWLAKGLKILSAQIAEQILPDGGHFERSPMYHELILEDILDLINLRRCFALQIPDWSEVASRMLGWLRQMMHPDGEIALFNDAAFGIAPRPAQIGNYAARLAITASNEPLGGSGYVRLERGETVLLFDAAPIGPDYQPGHAHADTLSFEVSYRGRRVLVNSGTSTYEKNAERLRQRSTAAHNTVRIDGADQSEIWGAFRVARRARPFGLKTDRNSYVEAAHTGYHRLPSPVTHRRRVELDEDRVTVTDTLEGDGEHAIELFWHLYPGAKVSIQTDPDVRTDEQDSTFHPEFGLILPNRCITGAWRGSCPRAITTVLILS